MKVFAEQLKYYRLKNNMSQTVLADYLNIGIEELSQYEKGLRSPNLDLVIKIAVALDVSMDSLIFEKGKEEGREIYFLIAKLNAEGREVLVNHLRMMVASGHFKKNPKFKLVA